MTNTVLCFAQMITSFTCGNSHCPYEKGYKGKQ